MSEEWKLVHTDALYPPDPAVVRQELERLALQVMDSIVVSGEVQVKVLDSYIPLASIDTKTLRVFCRNRQLRPLSRSEQGERVDESFVSALSTLQLEVSRYRKEIGQLRSGKPGHDVLLYWRGSATDLATDLAPLLTVEQLQELVGELAIRWREKSTKERG